MKKIIILMTALLAMGLASCGHESSDSIGTSENPYITFKGPEYFSIKIETPGWTAGGGKVEFSTNPDDDNSWTEWNDSNVTDSSVPAAYSSADECYCLYFVSVKFSSQFSV